MIGDPDPFPMNKRGFPRLYPILVPSRIGNGSLAEVCDFVRELTAGGATLIQLREKLAPAREILRLTRELRRILPPGVALILNDRADIAVAAETDGVHIGQDDIPADATRKIIGSDRILGLSTHNSEQVEAADRVPADYLAIGPVFSTLSKDNSDPVIGLDGVRKARPLTQKPLMAIGGITVQNCRSVIEAGADSAAVISELITNPRKRTEEFLQKMR